MRPSRFSTALLGVLGALTLAAPALAQDHGGMHHNHHNHATPSQPSPAGATDHADHAHDVGPAGAT